jgi:hypothetical protein
MKDLLEYLQSIPQSVVDNFEEDFGLNGFDLLMSGTVEEAKELLKDYFTYCSLCDGSGCEILNAEGDWRSCPECGEKNNC